MRWLLLTLLFAAPVARADDAATTYKGVGYNGQCPALAGHYVWDNGHGRGGELWQENNEGVLIQKIFWFGTGIDVPFVYYPAPWSSPSVYTCENGAIKIQETYISQRARLEYPKKFPNDPPNSVFSDERDETKPPKVIKEVTTTEVTSISFRGDELVMTIAKTRNDGSDVKSEERVFRPSPTK